MGPQLCLFPNIPLNYTEIGGVTTAFFILLLDSAKDIAKVDQKLSVRDRFEQDLPVDQT